MKIYNVKDIHGNAAKGITIKIDAYGKVKVIGKKELEFVPLVRGGKIPKEKKTSLTSNGKRRGRPPKVIVTSPEPIRAQESPLDRKSVV